MKSQYLFLSVFLLFGDSVMAEDLELPHWFTNALQSKGNAYRESVTNILNKAEAIRQMEEILRTHSAESAYARQAHILLARVKYPSIFSDYELGLQRFLKGAHDYRPGFLSGFLMNFTKLGPEHKVVDEYERDANGKIYFTERASSTNKVVGMRAVRKKVEKYTDAEVQAGIARNAAARQAVLEHFLKFLDEGDPYEQSEVVDAVYRLWGSASLDRRKDEPLADDLIKSVYDDDSRSLFVRYMAALWLPKEKQGDFQGFMLNVVAKSMSADFFKSDDLLNRTLSNLESSADAVALAALKSQTNGPKWKVDAVIKTTRKIESRLSKGDKKE